MDRNCTRYCATSSKWTAKNSGLEHDPKSIFGKTVKIEIQGIDEAFS